MGVKFALGAVVLALMLETLNLTAALDMAYCSTDNTGSGFSPISDTFQSDGLCFDTCKAQFAFAIVQDFDCWCSNLIPAEPVSVDLCDMPCPGYPNDTCGSIASGLFGYIALSMNPSGTAKAAAPSIPSTSSSHPATTSTTTTTTSSWTPTPFPSVITVTGEVQTIIITPTAPLPTETINKTTSPVNKGFFSNTGAVAGVFTTVALISVGIVGVVIYCCIRRSRKQSAEEVDNGPLPQTSQTPKRRSSLFDMGLFGKDDNNDLSPLTTKGLNRTGTDRSPDAATTPGSTSRPLSTLIHDQRLDPRALWNPSHPNGSAASVNTFQDNRDYSRRVLTVTNPDHDY